MRNPMLIAYLRGAFIGILLLSPVLSHAKEFRYRYIDLETVNVPTYDTFWPQSINDLGDVVGSLDECDETSCFDTKAAVYRNGIVTALQTGVGWLINNRRTIAGYLPDPTDASAGQAALFLGRNKRILIPNLTGRSFTSVFALNDRNDAIASGGVYYLAGKAAIFHYSPQIPNARFYAGLNLSNDDIAAGTNSTGFVNDRAFRFNVKTGEYRFLDPLPDDTQSWGLDANNRGYVIGYSFVNGTPYHERIGVWDRFGHFKTFYEETINTSFLAFNDRNEIIQPITGEGTYLIPRPGVRLNLADLVDDLPPWADLSSAIKINNRGDILGLYPSFLLKRICSPDDEREADAAAAAAVPARPISSAALALFRARSQALAPQPTTGPKHL